VRTTGLSFTHCTGPHGFTFALKPTALPWALNADTYNPAITAGLTTGTITGIHATLKAARCHAIVDGTRARADDGAAQIHYHNSLAKLKIRPQDSNLHIYQVRGCRPGLHVKGMTAARQGIRPRLRSRWPASCRVPVQQVAPPPTGATCRRPRDGGA
jgi:hypothetical protein